MFKRLPPCDNRPHVLLHMLLAAFSLFLNGIGVYLTIHANIGAGPWDVFNQGLSHTFGIIYGNASITVSLCVLLIDVFLHEPIGIAMLIDAVVVGKTVDLFDTFKFIPVPTNIADAVLMVIAGLFIIGSTQCLYMQAALGCGPRDTLLVGLKKRTDKIPISVISMITLVIVTISGYLLGGKIGIGTPIVAFCAGPIMEFCFRLVHFDATQVRHQHITTTLHILISGKNK